MFITSVVLKIPRFFHFEFDTDGTNYHTTQIMENATYISISAIWDDLVVTGVVPVLLLVYLNLQIYLKVNICFMLTFANS